MFTTATVREIPTNRPDVYAFHIYGEVAAEDMHQMAEYMNTQFDRHDSVSMLLSFVQYDGAESGASLDWETIKSRVRSIAKVDKYVVVGAPDSAADMIETFGKILPIDAATFDNEADAWAYLDAGPESEAPPA